LAALSLTAPLYIAVDVAIPEDEVANASEHVPSRVSTSFLFSPPPSRLFPTRELVSTSLIGCTV
jgi:hypothetical protein